MKRIFTAFFAAVLLAGCASSERMVRMSGGVLDNYSVPKKQRLRSEKYQKAENYVHGRDSAKGTVDPNATLVNLWPMFFRSNQYFSILWPIVDFDPYGMAVRPVYNQEGDDYSVLFPLSSWNVTDKKGWALVCTWAPRKFAVWPIAAQDLTEKDGYLYYTPLFIRNWKENDDVLCWRTLKKKTFTEFLLGYGGSAIRHDVSSNPLVEQYGKWIVRDGRDKELKTMAQYFGQPVPGDRDDLEKWVIGQIKAAPETKSSYAGFFPLFHWSSSPSSTSLWAMILFYGEKNRYHSEYSVLGPLLFQYENETLGERYKSFRREGNRIHYRDYGGWDIDMWLLLSRFDRDDKFKDTDFCKNIRHLIDSLDKNADIRSPYIQDQLKKLDPTLKLPDKVKDSLTLRMYLGEYFNEKMPSLPVEHSYSGGFLPLFNYSFQSHKSLWNIPALLTWYKHSHIGDPLHERTFWCCIPLLMGGSTTSTKDEFSVAWRIGYYSRTDKKPEGSEEYSWLYIHPRNAEWPDHSGSQVEHTDIYSLLGLLYRGKDQFLVEKENCRGANEVSQLLGKVKGNRDRIRQDRKNLAERKTRNEAKKLPPQNTPQGKIAHYEQLIEAERIKLDTEAVNKREAEYQKDEQKLAKRAKDIRFDIPADFASNDTALRNARLKLIRQTAELRGREDIGNGIIFRKEKFYNGNYKWHFCGVLAGGEKRGDFEKTHVFQLLYRYNRQGENSEMLCFPFIARQTGRDRNDFSFMWRVFHLETKNGKTGGHFLFIPF